MKFGKNGMGKRDEIQERKRKRKRERGGFLDESFHIFFISITLMQIFLYSTVVSFPFCHSFIFFLFLSSSPFLSYYFSSFFLSSSNPQGQGLAKCDLSARKTAVKTTKLFNVRLDYLTQFIKTSRYYIPEVGNPREEFPECFFNVVFFSFSTSFFSCLISFS